MKTKIFDEKYWTFYLELENEFKQIEKYIPINETNNETFSYKYMKLLFSICSEIDTILKSFIKCGKISGCKLISNSSRARTPPVLSIKK